MSDARLRDLERRWRDTRAVSDEAAYLVERLRAGDLDPERLRVAARCGHPAAVEALGEPPVFPRLEGADDDAARATVAAWLRGFDAFPREVRVRVALVLAKATLGNGPPHGTDPQVIDALTALERWCRCPCEADLVAVDAAVLLLPLGGVTRRRWSALGARGAMVAWLVLRGDAVGGEDWERPFEHPLVDLLEGAIDYAMDPRAVPAAIADELVPWALDLR